MALQINQSCKCLLAGISILETNKEKIKVTQTLEHNEISPVW